MKKENDGDDDDDGGRGEKKSLVERNRSEQSWFGGWQRIPWHCVAQIFAYASKHSPARTTAWKREGDVINGPRTHTHGHRHRHMHERERARELTFVLFHKMQLRVWNQARLTGKNTAAAAAAIAAAPLSVHSRLRWIIIFVAIIFTRKTDRHKRL